MDWLATISPVRLKTLLGLLWLIGPAYLMWQSLGAIARRNRLWSSPMTVSGEVREVLPGGDAPSLDTAVIVDLKLSYEVDGRPYAHTVTRTDHQRVGYCAGSQIDLVCEDGNPANVVDAARRPWDDVIGPMVFSVLLFLAMAWLWLILVGY